jgi:hypothetical protein
VIGATLTTIVDLTGTAVGVIVGWVDPVLT